MQIGDTEEELRRIEENLKKQINRWVSPCKNKEEISPVVVIRTNKKGDNKCQ